MTMDDGGRPSRASLREVKREYKDRQKAEKQRAKDAQAYWAGQSGRSSRRPGWLVPSAVIAVLAVVATGGMYALKVSSSSTTPTAAGASPQAAGGPSASAKARASSSSSDGTDPTVVPAFSGSPAKNWPAGAKGITTPRAKQVGIYRPAQVQEAYSDVARYLQVALLDPRVLYRGSLQPVLATLGPQSSQWLHQQVALGTKTKGKQGIGWDSVANRFHVGDWRAAAEVRVKGRMRASSNRSGDLVVRFVYVAAYWLVPAKGGSPRTIAVRRTGDMYFLGNGPSHVTDPNYGGSGYTSTAGVCGSTWPYPQFVEAWVDRGSVPVVSPSPVTTTFDPTDVNAADPTSCYTDTSGFGG